jgi:hypothetical protein
VCRVVGRTMEHVHLVVIGMGLGGPVLILSVFLGTIEWRMSGMDTRASTVDPM